MSKNPDLLRVACGSDKVYKDECVYCFNTQVNYWQEMVAMCVICL